MRWPVLVVLLVGGCGGGGGSGDGGADDGAPGDADSTDPRTLADTGLYADPGSETLAAGVRPFTPRWPLWTDGATKRRWILLPDDIDTSDMDYWQYPVGTKAWKEFTRDGIRVETRLLWKLGDGNWLMRAFVWNQDQTEAVAVDDAVMDANGTDHDVPSPQDCQKCHRRMPDVLIGFTALELDYDGPAGHVDLAALVLGGELSTPITSTGAGNPYFTMPDDPTGLITPALGVLHANCGACHNPRSDVHDIVGVEWRLSTAFDTTWDTTPPYQTAVGVDTQLTVIQSGLDQIVAPGDSANSVAHFRMNRRGQYQMPPLGTELVDTAGVATVDAWIDSL